ncbi:MAG: guanylate kinase, partial [Lactobacillus amylovorus]
TLHLRLEHRGTEPEEVIRGRIKQARNEILEMEDYDYAVVNDTVANAVDHIKAIVDAEHVSVKRVIDDYHKMVK